MANAQGAHAPKSFEDGNVGVANYFEADEVRTRLDQMAAQLKETEEIAENTFQMLTILTERVHPLLDSVEKVMSGGGPMGMFGAKKNARR